MKHLLISITTLMLTALFGYGAETYPSAQIWVSRVCDDVTEDNIADVEFDLRLNDSIQVALHDIKYRNGEYVMLFEGPAGNYTLWCDHEDYESTQKQFHYRGRSLGYNDLGDVRMKRLHTKKLNEVTVTGTHIKMVMRGDTIVYDAAAFELAEGSMLDALVSQLPGTELKDGRITVNGKFVSSLLVNGDEFFSGSPKVALENLPAYTVKNIKVYDRAADNQYLHGGKDGKLPGDENIVMDVNLKKEYSVGWIGNVDGGYGTSDRYVGKAFLLGYTERLRLAAYGNFNNIQDTQSAQSGGNWGGGWGQEGELAVKMGGLDYVWSKNPTRISGNLMLTHENVKVRTKESTQNFYDTGDIYGRSRTDSRDSKFHLISRHQLQRVSDNSFLRISPEVDYLTNNYTYRSESANFTINPAESYRGQALDSLFDATASTRFSTPLLTRTSNRNMGNMKWIIGRLEGWYDTKWVGAKVNGEYWRTTNRKYTTYGQTPGEMSADAGSGTQLTQQYLDRVSTNWNVTARLEHTYTYRPYSAEHAHWMQITASLLYDHTYADRDNILSQLIQEQAENVDFAPSAIDRGRLALDAANTNYSASNTDRYAPTVNLSYIYKPYGDAHPGNLYNVTLTLNDNIYHDTYRYRNEMQMDTTARRTYNTLRPTLYLSHTIYEDTYQRNFKLSYSYNESMPSLSYNINTINTSDPTNIYVNNPGLGRSRSHNVNFNYRYARQRLGRSINFDLTYNKRDNVVVQARLYDRNTGVSTWRPENINGNWSANARFDGMLPFGSNQQFQLNGSTDATYTNSVDYATETTELTRSIVRNLNIRQQLTLSYRLGAHSFSLYASAAWLRATSNLQLIDDINAWDVRAKANCMLNFPHSWQLSTDMNLYCRRGYNDQTLNTTDWVWNASISKSLIHNSLTLKVNAVDILNQISSVRYSINAQGRTETWTNTLPRYVMLHVIYRFHITPKRPS